MSKFKKIILRITILTTASIFSTTCYAMKKNSNVNNFLSHPYGPLHLNYDIEKLIDLNSLGLDNEIESCFDSISKISNNIQNDNNLSNFFSDDLSEISNINNNLNKAQTINDKIIPDVIEVNNNNSNEIKNNKNKTSKKSLLNKKRKNK